MDLESQARHICMDYMLPGGWTPEALRELINSDPASMPVTKDFSLGASADDETLVPAVIDKALIIDSDMLVSGDVPQPLLPVAAFVEPPVPVDEEFLDKDLPEKEYFGCSAYSEDGSAGTEEGRGLASDSEHGEEEPRTTERAAFMVAEKAESAKPTISGNLMICVHRAGSRDIPLDRFVAVHRHSTSPCLRAALVVTVLRSVVEAVNLLHRVNISRVSLHPSMIFVDSVTGNASLTCEGISKTKAPLEDDDARHDLAGIVVLSLWLLDDRQFVPISLVWLARRILSPTPQKNWSLSDKIAFNRLREMLSAEINAVVHPAAAQFVLKLVDELTAPAGPRPTLIAATLLSDAMFTTDVRVHYSQQTSVRHFSDKTAQLTAEQVMSAVAAASLRFGTPPVVQLTVTAPKGRGAASSAARLPPRPKKTVDALLESMERTTDRSEFDAHADLLFFVLIAQELLGWLSHATGSPNLAETGASTDRAPLDCLRDGKILALLAQPPRGISAIPRDRVAQFAAFCRDTLGMSSSSLFTFDDLAGAKNDAFVVFVLCRVAACMWRVNNHNNSFGILDARCPQPTHAMCVFGDAADILFPDNELCEVLRGKLDAISVAEHLGTVLGSRKTIIEFDDSFRLSSRKTASLQIISLLVDDKAAGRPQHQLLVKDSMRGTYVPLRLFRRLLESSFQPVKFAPPPQPLPPVVAESAPASVPISLSPARHTDPETAGAVARAATAGAAAGQGTMAVTASAPAYSAGEMAELFEDAMIFFTDGGFDDSSDPNLRTYCESHDKLHRVIPLLGTPRFDRIVKATDGIERAQSDMTELLFVLISDAAAYATTIAAGEEPLAWVLFDIATYVLHSDHDVQQKMAFAAKHGLTRTKMFTTPKFTTVCCEGRKELISWLDRIYGGARRTTSLSASGERLQ